ncbi:hypothetical protein [Bradyrhizobium sp. LB11.1]|jgi:hypothetical protein
MTGGPGAVNAIARIAKSAAMLKPDSDYYSAHDAEFFARAAVAAASRNI